MDSSFEKLADLFRRFPGIGPRQARRFAYYLLKEDRGYIQEFLELVGTIREKHAQCCMCFGYYSLDADKSLVCSMCNDKTRDAGRLIVCEKDVDISNIEKAGVYKGMYFILGGILPVLEKNPDSKIRSKELVKRIKEMPDVTEVIFALSASLEGDATREYVVSLLSEIMSKRQISITTLGRGLSTGAELEYSDSSTLKHAFKNRQ